MPFRLINEPEDVPLEIFEDENIGPALNPPSNSIERLSIQGFKGKEEEFGFVSDEPHLATHVALATTYVVVPRDEVFPSSGRGMKHVMIEVPKGMNLLKKSNLAAVWLKPLIGPLKGRNLNLTPLSL